jgi:integrase
LEQTQTLHYRELATIHGHKKGTACFTALHQQKAQSMARQTLPQPWYRTSKQAWFVRLQGKQHNLGKDEGEAFRLWHRLMLEQGKKSEQTTTIRTLIDAYLARTNEVSANTKRNAGLFLRSFVQAHGKMQAMNMRRSHVQAWLEEHPGWSDSTAWTAATFVVAAFNWGVREEHLPHSPIKGLQKPSVASRGADCVIDEALHQRLLKHVRASLRLMLTILKQTGCRPAEACSVTAADFNAEQGLWTLKQHKTARKGKKRYVLLTTELVALCQQQALLYPEGPLFRKVNGKAWTPHALSERFWDLRQRLGIEQPITPYSYRHSFATHMLEQGAPETHVAALLGHCGTTMLHKHYGHLDGKLQTLRQTLNNTR